MGKRTATTTEVEIYGAVYSVRGDDRQDEQYLQELAADVDGRMRQIAERMPAVDTARLAILVALNLADELFQCQRRQEGERAEIGERLTRLTGTLADALAAADAGGNAVTG
ncbi:MAG TPA: cell division protein ZapA [Thermoanaerobaculia bacterium]|nr:cell division protein ZapA [Thermoanaerobaculia bacterium]